MLKRLKVAESEQNAQNGPFSWQLVFHNFQFIPEMISIEDGNFIVHCM